MNNSRYITDEFGKREIGIVDCVMYRKNNPVKQEKETPKETKTIDVEMIFAENRRIYAEMEEERLKKSREYSRKYREKKKQEKIDKMISELGIEKYNEIIEFKEKIKMNKLMNKIKKISEFNKSLKNERNNEEIRKYNEIKKQEIENDLKETKKYRKQEAKKRRQLKIKK